MRKFSPGENFHQFHHLLLLANFLPCVNDYIEDMASFTTLAKIYSIEYFCSIKVAGLGEIFVQQNFCYIRYLGSIMSSVQYSPTVYMYVSGFAMFFNKLYAHV